MKYKLPASFTSFLLAFAFIGAGQLAMGQTSVQTTTSGQDAEQTIATSAGTISDLGPQMIVVKTENAPEPVHYIYSKTTTYVDEDGNPISVEAVKTGGRVTVYYTKDGDNLIVSKVIVRKSVVQADPIVQRSQTTTTTTTQK
jgi:hypothetical protein